MFFLVLERKWEDSRNEREREGRWSDKRASTVEVCGWIPKQLFYIGSQLSRKPGPLSPFNFLIFNFQIFCLGLLHVSPRFIN